MSAELAGWNSTTNNLNSVRPLTADEVAIDERAKPVFAEARERLKLFKILELNYQAWERHLRSEMMPRKSKQDGHLILDQLMLNFLNTVYAITEHFRLSYRQRYKKDDGRIGELKEFIKKLHANSWAVAFFADFRNYVQHCALPIGTYNRKETSHGVRVDVTQDAANLCKAYTNWKDSRLMPEHGTLDLIDLTTECYHRLRKDYGGFIAKVFYPELVDMDAFYWSLTQEVRRLEPCARMVFLTNHTETRHRTKVEMKMTLTFPPNAVFDELGMTIERKQPNQASDAILELAPGADSSAHQG